MTNINRYATLVIALIALIAITGLLRSSYNTLNFQPSVQQSNTLQPTSTDYNTTNITTSNLFGRSSQSNTSVALPATNLKLILRGAFTSTTPELASALIESPDGKTNSFRVNSKVYNNTVLHSVFNDRVILSLNGELETLHFPTAELNETNAPLNNEISKDEIKELVQNNASLKEIATATQQLQSSTISEEQRSQLIRSRLQELRNRARK
jgi:general secretion pathway protein C